MRCYPSFLEYLEWRSGVRDEGERSWGLEGDVTGESLAGRRSPFRGLFKVINPARPGKPAELPAARVALSQEAEGPGHGSLRVGGSTWPEQS